MTEETSKESIPVAPESPPTPVPSDRSPGQMAPNLKWPAATCILGGIVSYFLFLGDNWGVPETYIILGGYLLICIGSVVAIFYERDTRPMMGKIHRAYLLYGAFLLLGSLLAGIALGFGNILVPIIFPLNLAPIIFYVLVVTTLVISVEFGLSVVKNFRK